MARLRNAPLIARNLAQAVANRLAKFGRHYGKRAQRVWRLSEKRARASWFSARAAGIAARDGSLRVSRAAIHLSRQPERLDQHVLRPLAERARVGWALSRLARGSDPVIAGPWLSEVGFEALYWVPFLNWVRDRYGLRPDRVIAVSRGGVASWYGGVADTYVEILDLFDPAEFQRRNAERVRGGDQKQLGLSGFDADIVQAVKKRLGLSSVRVLHPSLMNRLLKRFWLGNAPLQFALDRLRFRMVAAPPLPGLTLPSEYAVVKFYTGVALPDTDPIRRAVARLIAVLAEQLPVVVLGSGLRFDEHEDFSVQGADRVRLVDTASSPQTNLAVQTALIARSTLFVGTCGSVAWLAPMLGVKTVAVYADDRFLTPHLYLARHAYRLMDAASFSTLDLRALEAVTAGQALLQAARR